jgi:hypothetical protein
MMQGVRSGGAWVRVAEWGSLKTTIGLKRVRLRLGIDARIVLSVAAVVAVLFLIAKIAFGS